MTKKEIVKQIADRIHETQLKTKEIVQLTFDAIIDTLIAVRRIELRNFGVFEVKLRRKRKARNPRTNEHVDVQPKFVVTFKPGKEMEERVGQLVPTAEELQRLEERKSGAKRAQAEQPAPEPEPEAAAPAPPPPAPPELETAAEPAPAGNGASEPDNQPTAKKKRPRKAATQT